MNKRKAKLIINTILVLIFISIIAIVIINLYIKSRGSGSIISDDDISNLKDVDHILILGCKVEKDGTPSDMLRDRLNKGIELYKQGVAEKIIVSGSDKNDPTSEIKTMKEYAVQNGVPEEDIITDGSGITTYDSIYRARDVYGVKKMIIVTQKYHIYRSLYIAEKLGVEAYGSTSDTHIYGINNYVREIFARCKAFVFCIFKPLPSDLEA